MLAQALAAEEGDPSGLDEAKLTVWLAAGEPVFLVSPDENPVAFAMLYPGFDLASGEEGFHLGDLFVAAGHRRLGIGRALLREAAIICRGQGGTWLSWTMRRDNPVADAFYARQGASAVDVAFRAMGKSALGHLIESV